MPTDNTAVLSYSHAVYSTKKKAKKDQIHNVVFDEEARREYLTGFHKRNLQKKENKRKNALQRERQQRLELRRQHRQELAEQAAKNVKQVESALGILPSHAPTETGSVNEEDEIEFENEEQFATVTVVEDFDPDSLNHVGPRQTKEALDVDPSQPKTAPSHSSQSRSQAKRVTNLRKSKPSQVRYETQASRKAERTKQRARRAEKAERADKKKGRSKR